MAHSPRDYQIASRYLRSGHVDGAVLVSMHGKRPLDLHSLGVPVVLAGRPFGNDEDLSYVDADNIGGACMAVRYLLSHGRGTVATVAGPPDMSPGVDRLRGRRVPDDVAVIGFEDSPLARHTDPKLTTVRQPVEAMGEWCASELLALIGRAGPDPCTWCLIPNL